MEGDSVELPGLVERDPEKAFQVLKERGCVYRIDPDRIRVMLPPEPPEHPDASEGDYLKLVKLSHDFFPLLRPLQDSRSLERHLEEYDRLGYDVEVVDYEGGGKWRLRPYDRREDESLDLMDMVVLARGDD